MQQEILQDITIIKFLNNNLVLNDNLDELIDNISGAIIHSRQLGGFIEDVQTLYHDIPKTCFSEPLKSNIAFDIQELYEKVVNDILIPIYQLPKNQ